MRGIHTRFDGMGKHERIIDVFGEDASSQTVRGVVCTLDYLIQGLELQNGLNWPENLLRKDTNECRAH